MPTRIRTFWTARRGHSSVEYEDAFAVNDAANRFAVADGASEGCFTGLWAKLLVEHFVVSDDLPVGEWADSLPIPQEQWNAKVHAGTLPWYAEEGTRQGAFATFLGFTIISSSANYYEWQAVAVGDACLLHTRKDLLLRVFPLDRAEQFDNFPKLVGSHTTVKDIETKQRLWLDGRGQSGDRLWIMTDALALWCLSEIEAGRNPWRDLDSLLAMPENKNTFAAWIESLRNDNRLHNDDVTLLAIEL